MKATEKEQKEKRKKRQHEPFHFIFIIMAYWINVESRDWQSLCRSKNSGRKTLLIEMMMMKRFDPSTDLDIVCSLLLLIPG